MRSNRLLVGVTCGVALALGVLAAVDAGTQTALAPDGNTTDEAQLAQGQKQLWASLDDEGDITHQSRAEAPLSDRFTSSKGPGLAGNYVVDFKRDVQGCSWSATPRGTEHLLAVTAPVFQAAATSPNPTQVGVYVYKLPTVPTPSQDPERPQLVNSFVDVQVLC
jgi:hypothetical protein